jgi:formylglycine-generating enzyme required for sulfatase activity
MDEIFISYKNERRKAAEHLAQVLQYYGYSVWFDYRLITGSDFGFQIDCKIREAKALVALWCSLSIGSRWFAEEIDLAHKLGILIPVKIEHCELPVGFRRQHFIDLSSWDGSPRSHQLDPLTEALERRIGPPHHLDLNGLKQYEATWRRFGAPSLAAFVLGTPLADVEGERHTAQVAAPSIAPASAGRRTHELMALAAREWPAVRDSADPQRLESFERHFAGTFYAEEARARREEIAAEVRQRDAARKQKAEERRLRAEGRIPVLVGDRDHNKTQWLLPGAGEPFCDLDGGPEMVVVPAGSFMMGSPETEPDHRDNESPQHRVRIARAFAVGRDAVTRGQFTDFVNATGHQSSGAFKWIDKSTRGDFKYDPKASWREPGFPQDDSHPVACVDWDDASAYVSWLAAATGKPYRLLAEAEWEYAARAGTTTTFWWGSSITPEQANYDGNFVYGPHGVTGEFRNGTVPVGSFAANPWGLYNVHGNVWEWCEDVWHGDYVDAPKDGSAWLQGGDSGRRVARGGSWYIVPRNLRAAQRLRLNSGFRFFDLGFRLARTLTS